MNSLHAIRREHRNARIVQTKKVMPLIGGLLDAWEGMSNDEKGALREDNPSLCEHLDRIDAAVEGALEVQAVSQDRITERLCEIAAHLESLDSESGEASIIRAAMMRDYVLRVALNDCLDCLDKAQVSPSFIAGACERARKALAGA